MALSACDEQRQGLADVISRPSAEEMAARIDLYVGQGKVEEAIKVGETYIKSETDPKGLVHQSLAKAYLSKGDVASATKHLEAAVSSGLAKGNGKTNELENSVSKAPNKSLPKANEDQVSVEGASVSTGKDGTVVRAGDAIVILKK